MMIHHHTVMLILLLHSVYSILYTESNLLFANAVLTLVFVPEILSHTDSQTHTELLNKKTSV